MGKAKTLRTVELQDTDISVILRKGILQRFGDVVIAAFGTPGTVEI